ncbi:venom serine protease Bi-VSP-like isoform X2 [Anopheles bellator]|uniref:venom serine protease Bi-VSP-like isoform X2 n=1 Tax=Anopheles bellator TaxID=139047 RepID=UPI0026487CC7|nr:venom serine protease Bi-VSP-like isoform X2 [Anopheles bellator]
MGTVGVFPDKVHLEFSDVLNKNCGDSSYTDWMKPEDGRPFENPWLILFRHPEESEPFCQGTLITSQHVLTSAICSEGIVINETTVVVGEYDRSMNPECNATNGCSTMTELFALHKIVHPNFINESYEYDIAVVTLSEKLRYSNSVKPICLPLTPIIPSNVHTPLAYNALWPEKIVRPKQIQMRYIPHLECRKFTQDLLALHEGQICAQMKYPAKISLIGGSGSPLLTEFHDRSFQFGILSIGMPDARSVEPFVYVNISTHITWIHETVINSQT